MKEIDTNKKNIKHSKDSRNSAARKVFIAIRCFFAILGVTLGMTIVCIYGVMLVCTHGPSKVARDLFVMSVRESSMGGFLANMVVSKSTIERIEAANTVRTTNEISDTELIEFNNRNHTESTIPEDLDDGERKPYKDMGGVFLYEVSGATYSGTMVVINDPSRVMVGVSGDFSGEPGINVPAICDKYGAVLAANAGGFEDIGGVGDGGTPRGIVMSEGTLRYGSLTESYDLIGFDNNNVFVIGNMTGQQAVDRGIRDAVSFGPFLILNGTPLEVSGMGGGLNPRTAIGQRADGAVLLLIIDGRQAHSLGASMNDLINEMLDFGAVNAANLDGGGSTVLYYDGEIHNKISSVYGARGVPTAIIVRNKEKS